MKLHHFMAIAELVRGHKGFYAVLEVDGIRVIGERFIAGKFEAADRLFLYRDLCDIRDPLDPFRTYLYDADKKFWELGLIPKEAPS